ncbi:MAG TPA: NADH-quinone oxidoreductase subunit NuoH [Bdellovibrionota bacterium]|jgi:NADH-quinone oxidoreductase subunit H|nr:NADH-quinone oxidoreductase subunit NuoH [Bdellovibrionota bacterium]
MKTGFDGVFGVNSPLFIFSALAAVIVILGFAAPLGGFCTFIERRLAAGFQERIGPNRVGPAGLFQMFSDILKLLLKEDTITKNADRVIFALAPSLVLVGSLGAFATIPFTNNVLGADLDIGIFWAMALGSVVSLGVLLGAWSSDNKWSLLGGMRGAAQIVSFEIPLGIAILSAITVTGTLSMHGIVKGQAWITSGGGFWNIIHNPFLFINFFVYFIASLAECNRVPFDLPEAESELVSGFNTEFSGFRYALYMLGEFCDIILFAGLGTAVFLGGWQLPFVNLAELHVPLAIAGMNVSPLVQTGLMGGVFLAKMASIIFVVMWLRWTLPRLRVDQLMAVCWKYLIPISFFNLLGSALWVWLFKGQSILQLVWAWTGVN